VPQQRTIAEKIACRGIGLHSGEPVELTLSPAHTDTGVVFVARQGETAVEIPAREEFVSSTANATTLSKDGASVATVEHLLAALCARGVDNVRVGVDGTEIPVMDGSAASFDYLIRTAGLFPQARPRAVLTIRRPVFYTDGLRSIRIEPARVFRISYAVDFAHPAIGRQELEIEDLTAACFEKELARARTFGFLDEVDALRRAGLARGASLENTVVLDDTGVMNEGGLRWPDEFVRHKVLDLLGDLALIGCPIQGHVRVERGGHSIHRALLRELREHPEAWKLVAREASTPGDPARAPAFSRMTGR
jgi:UDP-3-O-[3-hydroxymyristoyl] N-acetylglucosamine deacetylase